VCNEKGLAMTIDLSKKILVALPLLVLALAAATWGGAAARRSETDTVEPDEAAGVVPLQLCAPTRR
jgi:hypothetical protein